MKAKILLVEGKRTDRPSFILGLTRKGYQVDSVLNGSGALEHLRKSKPDLVVINAASMRTSGKRICQSIRQFSRELPVVVIVETQTAESFEKEETANAILVLPFTLQKLLNRIRPLLPAEQKDLIQVGAMQLDTAHRVVRIGVRQARLTPNLVNLLRELMEHAGEVIEREALFRQVWDTEYTEDTRTLDVHISWLRQAIEDDPRNPQYVKTVRGVGYRLDIDAR
jgi:DNA-binding response OmpR family regulator